MLDVGDSGKVNLSYPQFLAEQAKANGRMFQIVDRSKITIPDWVGGDRTVEPKNHIYALLEPDTNRVRYIGKSIRPKERLQNHLNDKAPCHRTNWLRSLKARGLAPIQVIIESIPIGLPWQDTERWWIKHGRENGWDLVNETSGGDGVPELSAEARARVVKASTGRKHRPDTCALMSAQRLGVPLSLETRKKMSAKQKGRIITWGREIAAAIRKFSPFDVMIIQHRLTMGERTCALAIEYGVHRVTMSKIKMGTYFNPYRKSGDK